MNRLETELLWLGYEDDTGLWETPWERDRPVRGAQIATREEVRETLIQLAATGMIEVLAGPESVDFEDAEIVLVAVLPDLLNDERAWEAGDVGDRVVRYRTTDLGFQAYREATGWRD